MKKLLLAFLLAPVFLHAQDYRAYLPGRTAFFQYQSGSTWHYDALYADVVTVSIPYYTHTDYKREVANPWNMTCLAFSDTGWGGRTIVLNVLTGDSYFFNLGGDSISFYAAAGAGRTRSATNSRAAISFTAR